MSAAPGAEGEGLVFLGKATAVISHSIKNVMATVSETAGLIGDLVALAERDPRRIDLKELGVLGETIVEEIQRGFQVVQLLNKLAHSGDQPVADVDVEEVVTVVSGLGRCLAYCSGITRLPSAGERPRIRTQPLLLQDLLYRALDAAFRAVGPDGEIKVGVERGADGVCVALQGLPAGFRGIFESPGVELLKQALCARIALDKDAGVLRLVLPESLDEARA
ncbi:MAG: hypothetical protein HY812_12385 [Planctomycetes bacterium]|nr:hypothetical protein [Planctomycetota bacterium]